ncbi:LEA type 2 family protein [Burkholderia sp. Ac-20379]|uniref:LEA type 2 family protein n=1 Tax=Burkholderia sp. Ac-20379 TaxID=2703900 RepID=UPI00197D6C7D|nr:LEA type 2 family protein [Burkholderia sp. Ac-20379]MBN3725829.1 water stress/hypersensitive response domain-containing protein [Burkholderia sp. Ac-20379]
MRRRDAMRWLALAGVGAGSLPIGGCATLGGDPLRVGVVGLDPLPGQGLEMRFALRLRVQNPNGTPIDYDGIALDLDLNDRAFASGVSDARGTVPRFGEAVVSVPITVTAFAAARQAFAFADAASAGRIPYRLRGKLSSGVFGGMRFTDAGSLTWPVAPAYGGY